LLLTLTSPFQLLVLLQLHLLINFKERLFNSQSLIRHTEISLLV